jgi:transcriptional regulator with XRE-family HTH domain
MRLFSGKIIEIIEQSGFNLNHISKASGVSNPYLAKLVQGNINRPGKDKIASIMLALNHTISEINAVLSGYDYQPLHDDDIPAIVENNRRRKIEGGNLPQYDHIYFDLLLVALERIGGARILVKNRPSGIFMPRQLYLLKEYPYESDDRAAQFRYRLTDALLKERMALFLKNCAAGHRLETYICRSCLDDYLDRHISIEARRQAPQRAELVVQYAANALSLALKRPELHPIRIMERCSYFHFLMQDADSAHPKVSYPGRKLHVFNNQYDMRMLEGFTTDLPHIVAQFRHEIEMCRGAVDASLVESYPDRLRDYFLRSFDARGMGKQLESALAIRMETTQLAFF